MRRLAMFVTALGIGAAAACEKSTVDISLPPTEANVTGSFALVSADGRAVPFDAIFTNTDTWTLTSDRIVLLANNTWVDTTQYSVVNRGTGATSEQSTNTAGTYSIVNSQIKFIMTAGGTATFDGSVVANVLAVNFQGARYVYSR